MQTKLRNLYLLREETLEASDGVSRVKKESTGLTEDECSRVGKSGISEAIDGSRMSVGSQKEGSRMEVSTAVVIEDCCR